MSSPDSSAHQGTLVASPEWVAIDFISDLHLQSCQPETYAAFARYLQDTQADALFILGDLFEVWVGDDILDDQRAALSGFEQDCQRLIAQASERLPIFFIHGNRDFLFGHKAAQSFGMRLLDDPTPLTFDNQRWLLSHGDALCTDDEPYQRFRRMVRGRTWQETFLAKPLQERVDIARSLRAQSETRKAQVDQLLDLDAQLASEWLERAQACVLIHGHTHQPAEHSLRTSPPLQRWVLSDWDAVATPARLEILRLQRGTGLSRMPLDQALRP